MAETTLQQLHTKEKLLPSTMDLEDKTSFLISKLRMLQGTLGSLNLVNNELLLKGDAIHGLEITIRETADHLQLMSELVDYPQLSGDQNHE